MKKFAIIGGSFNPVTKAHVEIGQIAARELPGWQILYIPAPDRFLTSWKAMEKNDILSGEQRLNLLRAKEYPGENAEYRRRGKHAYMAHADD